MPVESSIRRGVKNRPALSVAIITLNEEGNLPRCLESVRELARETIVIDSGSTDGTRAVAEKFGAVFEVNPWPGYVAQKNAALKRCTQPWVLCLDADEAVSPELEAAIRKLFASGEPRANGFSVDRLNFYLGQWICHAWNPEWRLRLVRRESAQWVGLDVHEKLEVGGAVSRLDGKLLHYPFSSLMDHFQNTLKYARLAADSFERTGRPVRWYQPVFSPWMAFLKVLVLKGGWRDGWRGWVIAGAKWFNVFAKYAFLLERRWSPPDKPSRA
jgi:glycosyltransferase involved in cell wall biosynthesis